MNHSLKQQNGFSLLVTLVMVTIMTLLAIALARYIDTGNQVINNITYKQSALLAADRGTEIAVRWIGNNSGLLLQDRPADGYYRTVPAAPVDYTGMLTRQGDHAAYTPDDVQWPDGDGKGRMAVAVAGTDDAGNTVAYLIERLCMPPAGVVGTWTGVVDASFCVTGTLPPLPGLGGDMGGGTGGVAEITGSTNEIGYRITARSVGPRNTVSYVQTIVMMAY